MCSVSATVLTFKIRMIKVQTDRKYAISVSLTVAIFTLVEKGQRVIRNPQIGKERLQESVSPYIRETYGFEVSA